MRVELAGCVPTLTQRCGGIPLSFQSAGDHAAVARRHPVPLIAAVVHSGVEGRGGGKGGGGGVADARVGGGWGCWLTGDHWVCMCAYVCVCVDGWVGGWVGGCSVWVKIQLTAKWTSLACSIHADHNGATLV